jgi:hypothetical protein
LESGQRREEFDLLVDMGLPEEAETTELFDAVSDTLSSIVTREEGETAFRSPETD